MDVFVPLTATGAEAVSATAFFKADSEAKLALHPRIVHGGGGICCVYDAMKAVVLSLDEASGVFHLLCVIFFRRKVNGTTVLSFTRNLTVLLDAEQSWSQKALVPSTETHVSISEDEFVEQAAVLRDGAIAVMSRSGLLGCISASSFATSSPSAPRGCFIAQTPIRSIRRLDIYKWAVDAETSTVARIGRKGIALYRLVGDEICSLADGTACQGEVATPTIDVGGISSSACFFSGACTLARKNDDHGECTLSWVHRTTRILTVLQLSSTREAKHKPVNFTVMQQPLDLTVFPNPEPQILLTSTAEQGSGDRLVAVLYPDCVVFGTAVIGGAFAMSAVLKNELSLAFTGGCWGGQTKGRCRFLAFRSDSVCLTYELAFEAVPVLRIVEVTLASQFPIPFPAAASLPSLADRIVAVRNTEALLHDGVNGGVVESADGGDYEDDGVVFLQESDSNGFLALVCGECFCGSKSSALPASMRVFDVLCTRSGYNFITAFDNGECLAASTQKRGKRQIATELKSRRGITSCLTFEKDTETICVFGYQDGDVEVFVGDRFSSLVRMAHCGPVDKLVLLSNGMQDGTGCDAGDGEASFVSISIDFGTICFHTGESAEITKTLTSPSRPLTSCYVDRRCEYVFAFSNITGNLWHLPTCRLERTYTCSSASQLTREDMDDLLATRGASTLGIQSFAFLGQIHYSISVNLAKVVAEVNATREVSRDVTYVLPLLLRCCSLSDMDCDSSGDAFVAGSDCRSHAALVDHALINALEDLALCVLPSSRVTPCLGAIVLTCAIAEAATDRVVGSHALALSFRLLDLLVQGTCTSDEASALHALLSYYNVLLACGEGNVSPWLREGFARMAARVPHDLIDIMAAELLPNIEPEPLATNSESNDRFAFLAAIFAARTIAKAQSSADVVAMLQKAAKGMCLQFLKKRSSCDGGDALSIHDCTTVSGLAAGYALFSGLHEMREVLRHLVSLSFTSTNADVRHRCTTALMHIVATDTANLVLGELDPFALSHLSLRPNVVIFLARFVKFFPGQASAAFETMLDLALRAMSVSVTPSMSSDLRALCSDATVQLVRVAAAHIPSVSFQQNLLQVAVGQVDGCVKVYNLRTAEVVTTFRAHGHPIVCLSYSSNTASHDIATVSAKMGRVKVFRARKPTTSIVSLFSAAASQFKLETEVELPATEAPLEQRTVFARYCGIRWLSPQCVEFSSPWHEKIQMTL